MRIFLAGAAGAVGSRLIPLLVSEGHSVLGLTRTRGKAEAIRRAGADVVVLMRSMTPPSGRPWSAQSRMSSCMK
jgi:uncharacterized protein YbjT (DUF2867 family)